MNVVFAFCTYNRADRLRQLIHAIRQQECTQPFQILVINNNSSDDTESVLQSLTAEPGIPLHYVNEAKQGISHARNRALEEAMSADFLYFMDDDELPQPGLLNAAINALANEDADCVGGRIVNHLTQKQRPAGLGEWVLGVLPEKTHREKAFWETGGGNPKTH